MKKTASNEVKRGQAISFRIPSDTPDHILKQIQHLKETEKRNFSSKIAEYVLEGVNSSYAKEREAITISLPKRLTKEQRDWLKHEHSEALLGSIIYQLIADPLRSTAILASFNSKSADIDEALYLQEEDEWNETGIQADEEKPSVDGINGQEDDLSHFDWESAKKMEIENKKDQPKNAEDPDDLLGGFLARMNK